MHTFLVKRLDPYLLIYTSFVVSACDSRPCKNNGTCHGDPESGLAVCSCSVGYSGETCEGIMLCWDNVKEIFSPMWDRLHYISYAR